MARTAVVDSESPVAKLPDTDDVPLLSLLLRRADGARGSADSSALAAGGRCRFGSRRML
jgi:hypothetical protein